MTTALHMSRLLLCEVAPIKIVSIVRAVGIDRLIGKVLTAVGTDHIVFFQLTCVFINEASPFVHFVACFLIELLLVEIVLLL
jgi:hypothetical protein